MTGLVLQIVNRSKIAAEVSFSGCAAALEQQGIELHPVDFTILPRGIAELTFTFRYLTLLLKVRSQRTPHKGEELRTIPPRKM